MAFPHQKPNSQACRRNRDPILEVLKQRLQHCSSVLEVGSGTGQHAVYFARHLNHLIWQTSDLVPNHGGIQAWIDDAELPNVVDPIALDVASPPALTRSFDAVFTANSLHIMSWQRVRDFFALVGRVLCDGGLCLVYGPVKYGGRYTSPSNAQFDVWLKQRDASSGIRDFEMLDQLARNVRMVLMDDVEMPANNRILVWERKGPDDVVDR